MPVKTAAVLTLGCRLNHADSALLTRRLEQVGYRMVSERHPDTDLIVVNSCAVTAEAVRKSRQALRRCRQNFPFARLVVTGCAALLHADDFKADGADLVLGNPQKVDLIQTLAGLTAAEPAEAGTVFYERSTSSFPFRSRAFIKIQEGCNNFCTYCIVPYLRGRERSRDHHEVLSDCRQAIADGFPEIILTGVNTCAYNADGRDLGALVREIAALPGDFRIRLSSTEPHPHNLQLLDVMADTPKVCRFLHLSLQHGCDRILQQMNRHYSTADYRHFVELARRKLPGIHIGTDLIVGFPGETEADFEANRRFVAEMAFANMHIFTYSPRPGTPAADYGDQVPAAVAARRSAELKQLAAQSARNFAASQLGQALPVIFETKRNGFWRGWSDNYLEVVCPEDAAEPRKIVTITVKKANLPILSDT